MILFVDKLVVYSLERGNIIVLINANDNIELSGALIYHSDVNACACKCAEDSGSCSLRFYHSSSYYSDEGEIFFYKDVFGIYSLTYRSHNITALFYKLLCRQYYTHGVDARRKMLEGNAVVLDCLQYPSTKAKLCGHHILLYRYGGESNLTCYACNNVRGDIICFGNDEGTSVLGSVCVSDVYRNFRVSYGENCFLVQYGSAHIRELSELFVCNGIDNSGIIYASGARNFFLNDIDEALNVKSVKFSASGATTADLVKFFNIAKDAKGNKLKKVFLSLDVYSMNKDPETAHYKDFEYLYRSDLKEEYRYYFSRQTYSAMLYLIKRKFRPSKKRQHQTDPNRMFSTEYAGMKFGKAVVLEDAVKNVRIHHTMAPENPAVFAKNLREQLLPIIADNQNIQFVVYLAPYHIYTYCQSEQFKEADALIRQRTVVMNELLKYPNVTLFDFQADRSFVCNDEYFSDVQHFSSAAARVLLKKLASGERKITSIAEINANEAELRALIAEQMPSYYADIKNYKEPKR